ncbi:hypothetical protein ESN35_04945 [Bifidobacterium pullorum subsp. gallinarum]|uniref:Fibronectin type-III domain-containing protein n=1 Tax=Bifidobacterium pullorum subsp. gallinarum TaxID=78344 RepID=A0A4P6DSB1_9BIFI|nr:hypothetical protein [Bifidobacterium pullorum]QAY32833.1 hypothetical protein ESN35_04945 [Bifidobacterium pullorum subsp. gallinarum]
MGRSLHIRLHAYAPDGTSLGMLPRPLGVDADFQHNDAGTLKVTYSRLALGGSILQRGLEQGLGVGFEVSDGGEWIEPYNARFVLTSRSRDAKDRSDTVTLNLMTYAWLLKKALLIDTSKLLADGDSKGKRPFYSANPGTIVKTMLDENRERGGVAQYVTAGFDTGKDSSGAAWSNVMTLYYDPGIDCFTALSNLAANGVCDWRTRGMTLNMWNADSAALCHDLSESIVIPLATQALESPEEETIEDLASHILVMGDGIDFTQDNNAAPTPWGKWELYSSQGGVSDEGTARLLMQSQLDQAARVRGQYTRSVLVTNVDALPLIDYHPGDWITAPTVSHGEKVRVQRVTISLSNQGLKAALILNDRLYDAQTRQAKRIQGITGGAVAGGAQGGRPAPAQDHRVPKAPEGLVLSSDAYLDSTGHARGLVSAVWGEVSQATDNTSIEIADYRVEWRYSDSDADAWMSAGVTSDERLSWSNLDCGRTVVVRVRAIPTYSDRNGEWSGEKSVTVASDVTPPSVPSVPKLSSETGIVSISWDGLPATGTGMDADFDHCEVGRGLTSRSLAVVSAAMTGRTQWVDTDVLPGAIWVYALRAVDHAGNKSAWSKTAQIEVVGAVSREQIDQIQSDLAENEKTLDQARKDIQANQSAISQTQQTVSQVKTDMSGVKTDLTGVKTDLTDVKTGLDKAQSDLTQVRTDLTEANKELDQVGKTASDAASKAQQAYTAATGAQKTADGLHNIFKGWQDPATMSGVTVKTGDFWYRTQQYWTTSQGEADDSPSLLANFYTYSEGEPDNSSSVLVPLESEVVEVLTWDGEQWNQFNLVASNVIASGSVIGDLIAANTITTDHLAAGSVTTDKLTSLAVTADKLAANSVTAGKIAALAVTADKLAANSVTAGKIAANAVTAGTIAAGAVTTDKLAALSVTAAKIAALTITGDKIAANAINADKLAANAVTADKLAANSVNASKIVSGAITADKLAANSVTAVAIAAGSITTDKIKAGQFSGYVFTGAIYQSSTAEDTGFKLRDSGLDMWDSDHNHTVHLDGNGETNVVTGRFKTAFDGARIEFSTATVDDPQMGEIYTGAIDFHDSEGLVGQLYATSSGSGMGLIKIQPAGSQIAQMTVQRYGSSLTSEVGTTISANDGTGKTASVGANVLPNPSIAMTGALGKNGTFSWFQWKALNAGFGVHSYAHGTVNAMPLRYGRYYAWANADCGCSGIVAHVENTGGTSGWGVTFFNCDVSAAGGDIYCMTMGINAS